MAGALTSFRKPSAMVPSGYLFCDEINQASPQMQGVLGGLVLYGTIGDYSSAFGLACHRRRQSGERSRCRAAHADAHAQSLRAFVHRARR